MRIDSQLLDLCSSRFIYPGAPGSVFLAGIGSERLHRFCAHPNAQQFTRRPFAPSPQPFLCQPLAANELARLRRFIAHFP
jgi:hypothetical protein